MSVNQMILSGGIPSPSENLSAYLAHVSRIPSLSPEEERALALRWRSGGDTEAAYVLVISHLRLVASIAREYFGYGLDSGDLVQEGNLGLMKAVKRFDPDVGARLSTFASHWIRAAIHEFVIRNWRIVKIATTKSQRKLFYNLRKMSKSVGWLSEQEKKSIAEDLNVDVSDVNQMEGRLRRSDACFDTSPSNDQDFGTEALGPSQVLFDKRDIPDYQLEMEDEHRNLEEGLKRALSSLDERSRLVIEHRWLKEKKKTLAELSSELGVSGERVRQIESNALKKMRGFVGPDTRDSG